MEGIDKWIIDKTSWRYGLFVLTKLARHVRVEVFMTLCFKMKGKEI